MIDQVVKILSFSCVSVSHHIKAIENLKQDFPKKKDCFKKPGGEARNGKRESDHKNKERGEVHVNG